jgi:hypothetical protein
MERLQYLISKLNEQFEQNVPPSQMLVTVQLIETELTKSFTKSSGGIRSTKISVVMPSALKISPELISFDAEEEKEIERKIVEKKGVNAAPDKRDSNNWPLYPLDDIPTLAHQHTRKELNDVIGTGSSSINDKLKDNVLELAASLKETPIRELKKAIGVNDRYVFINELFRGDEPMYERSIKTINNFRILPEAEYWMERELKIKLGWDDSREITKHFYQLVKRRFS